MHYRNTAYRGIRKIYHRTIARGGDTIQDLRQRHFLNAMERVHPNGQFRKIFQIECASGCSRVLRFPSGQYTNSYESSCSAFKLIEIAPRMIDNQTLFSAKHNILVVNANPHLLNADCAALLLAIAGAFHC
jgi:hypothetical protein